MNKWIYSKNQNKSTLLYTLAPLFCVTISKDLTTVHFITSTNKNDLLNEQGKSLSLNPRVLI